MCDGIESYDLCKKWNRVQISYDEFKKRIQIYKDSLNKTGEKVEEKEQKNIFLIIFEFIGQYSLFIFGSIIIVCFGIICYLKSKDDFDLRTK